MIKRSILRVNDFLPIERMEQIPISLRMMN